MRDFLRCLSCNEVLSRNEPFMDVSLCIQPYGSNAFPSLDVSFLHFTQPEILNHDNQFSCQHCKKKCDAIKGVQFKRFPKILTLHLKRFDYNYDTLSLVKIVNNFTYPDLLDLTQYTALNAQKDYSEQSQMYQLFSVIIHRGSANGGHYFAIIKNLSTGKWYEFNDTCVTEVSPELYQEGFGNGRPSTNTAIILMYHKI